MMPAVRMGMSVADGERLADAMFHAPEPVAERLEDQLWLRSVLVEQMRRMRIAERDRFAARADQLLAALDPHETT
jgi:hypothetical protein